jgi:hypothetical protein
VRIVSLPVDQPFSSVIDALAVTEIAASKVAALSGGGEGDAGVIVGRLVIGDMMSGRGAHAADRVIIPGKIRAMRAGGPAGWWRLAKNVWRFTLRHREKPLPTHRSAAPAREAGFVDARVVPVVAEAAILSAPRPPRPQILRDAADPGRRDRVALPRLWALVKVGTVTRA